MNQIRRLRKQNSEFSGFISADFTLRIRVFLQNFRKMKLRTLAVFLPQMHLISTMTKLWIALTNTDMEFIFNLLGKPFIIPAEKKRLLRIGNYGYLGRDTWEAFSASFSSICYDTTRRKEAQMNKICLDILHCMLLLFPTTPTWRASRVAKDFLIMTFSISFTVILNYY